MNKKAVSDYYDYTLPFYKYFWHKNAGSYAIHYGFWDKNTKNLEDALQNTNKFLADKAQIQKGDFVLDAGCGIGGSSIWLAKNLHANVTGIAISEKQIKEAKRLAQRINVHTLTKFYVMNYLKTDFKSNSFDVVWAIESVCHAEDKKDFIKEAYRLLKKEGILIVADGFIKRQPKNDAEHTILNDFNAGLALPNLASVDYFRRALKEVGFSQIRFWDKTIEVFPSSKRLYDMCKIGYPLAKVTEKLGITSPILTKNNLAGIAQYKALQIDLGVYGVFSGIK